jgi:hypothetical protein
VTLPGSLRSRIILPGAVAMAGCRYVEDDGGVQRLRSFYTPPDKCALKDSATHITKNEEVFQWPF